LDRALEYEKPIFEWLESAVVDYDTIIEIGANVGVYSVFFGRHQRRIAKGLRPRVFAFEPSATAFRRLLQNLSENKVAVHAMQRAVAENAGVVAFYEPSGHLTNGSLRPDFASIFSSDVSVNTVQAINGDGIAEIVGIPGRTLLKIDVEGAEPEVLRSLRAFIETNKPDILIEVLSTFLSELQTVDFLDTIGYRYYAFQRGALVERSGFDAENGLRDMILRCPLSAF
jgi:FkbM family methyltransferase